MSSHPSSLKKDITVDCTVLRVLILSASFFKSSNKMSPEAIYEDSEIEERGLHSDHWNKSCKGFLNYMRYMYMKIKSSS